MGRYRQAVFPTMRQAVELLRACLDRIEATGGQLQSFVTLMADEAVAQARTAEAELLQGRYRGSMHGIPFALKDLYDTAGVRCQRICRPAFSPLSV